MTGNDNCSFENCCIIELVCFNYLQPLEKNYRYVHCKANRILQNISLFATSRLMYFIMKTTQTLLSKATYVSLQMVIQSNKQL